MNIGILLSIPFLIYSIISAIHRHKVLDDADTRLNSIDKTIDRLRGR